MPPEQDQRRRAPAAARNREPILRVLEATLPERGAVLEVASGTGQHVAFFAPRFPQLTWQPSDADAGMHPSIRAWTKDEANVRPPLALDVSNPEWAQDPDHRLPEGIGAILAINLIHIAPWAACQGLLAGAKRALPENGVLVLYGPYRRGGRHTAPSNAAFDESLRARDPDWGVRDLDTVTAVAAEHGLALERVAEMPVNNLTVVFRKAP
jgi:hypothetical protein